jgi:hypothetical protein
MNIVLYNILYNFSHMVVNGGNKFIDLEHMRELKKKFNLDVDI